MRVARTDETLILGNHEERILALERAPAGTTIYVDDRILVEDADHVTFDGFPANSTIIEVTWNCWLASGSDMPALMYLAFNDNYPPEPFVFEWRWRLAGSVELDTYFGDGDSGAGGLAFLRSAGGSWGRVRFPGISRASPSSSPGQLYLGEGAGNPAGGSDTPDVWQISGYAQTTDPITAITLFAGTGTDITPQQSFGADSEFTLTAYS